MSASLSRKPGKQDEYVRDYLWLSTSQIKMPSSTILIGDDLYSAGDLTFDFGNGTGDNGLDTGTAGSNVWYALYAVPKNDNKSYVLKASRNLPIEAGGAGPVGFPVYRYLGLFRVGGADSLATNLILPFAKSGSKILLTYQGASSGIVTKGTVLVGGTGNVFFQMTFGTGGTDIPYDNAIYRITCNAQVPTGSRYYVAVTNSGDTQDWDFMAQAQSSSGSCVAEGEFGISTGTGGNYIRTAFAGGTGLIVVCLSGIIDPYIK